MYGYCKEKIVVGHYWDLRVNKKPLCKQEELPLHIYQPNSFIKMALVILLLTYNNYSYTCSILSTSDAFYASNLQS